MRQRTILFSVLVWTAMTVWAQGPNNTGLYYRQASGKSGKALKSALCGIIKAPSVKGYKTLQEYYKQTDKRPDGLVRDRYSCATNYDFTDNTGGYNSEGDMYNKEHSFPKSWFGGKVSPMYSDIVHVIPADGYVNNRRGNYPLGENNGETYKSYNAYSKVGKCTFPGYSGVCFEPNDEWKGDFARIYFYMVTCYEESLAQWSSPMLDGSTDHCFAQWALDMLLEWSRQDPVSQIETDRNQAVYTVQKNRNPFVDYPGLEEYIWGTKTTETFLYDSYEGATPGSALLPHGLAFATTSLTAEEQGDFEAPQLLNPHNLPVTYMSSNEDVAMVDEQTGFVVIGEPGVVSISAVFAGNEEYAAGSASYTITVRRQGQSEGDAGIFERVTSASQLESGKRYLIVYEDGNGVGRIFSGVNANNVGQQTDGDIVNNTIDNEEGEGMPVTLLATEGGWLIKAGEQYLAYTTTGGNKLYVVATPTDNSALWTVTPSRITNVRDNNRRLQYNISAPRFCCYTGSQKDVTLYKEKTSGTGVEAPHTPTLPQGSEAGAVYDLRGAQVGTVADQQPHGSPTLPQGVYIVNGKKIRRMP